MLSLIRERPGITVPKLSETLGVDVPSLYRVVRKLQSEGTVSKDWQALRVSVEAKPAASWHRRRPREPADRLGSRAMAHHQDVLDRAPSDAPTAGRAAETRRTSRIGRSRSSLERRRRRRGVSAVRSHSSASRGVLEQALEEERRAPRVDREPAAGRLEPQPHEAAAGVDERRAVERPPRAATIAPPDAANASRAALPQAPAAVSSARTSMPTPVRSTSMAARSAPSSSNEATSMPSREACASAP